jgi:hypothetical protein
MIRADLKINYLLICGLQELAKEENLVFLLSDFLALTNGIALKRI